MPLERRPPVVERELLAREPGLADFVERDEEDEAEEEDFLLREPLLRASWALRMFRFAAARCRVVAMMLLRNEVEVSPGPMLDPVTRARFRRMQICTVGGC